jgi:iron(III) transport system substrate-binding protein
MRWALGTAQGTAQATEVGVAARAGGSGTGRREGAGRAGRAGRVAVVALGVGIIVGLVVGLVPGTAGPAGAAPGDSITVYSGRNEALIKPLFDQFTRDTGIEVQVRYGDSGALASQMLTEGGASPADVFVSQDAGALGALTNARLLAKLPPRSRSAVAPEYRADDGTWVGTSGRVRVLVYNPKLLPDPPTTIDEVVDPRYKGKVGYAPTNASWQSFVTGLRVLRGERKAEKWLRAFAANEPKAYASNAAIRDAVDAGQIWMGLVNHYYLWQKIVQNGESSVVARNQFMAPGDPGGLVNVAGVGVLKSSKNKKAAQVLVDYMLSEKGQAYFADSTYEYPLAAGVQPSVRLPSLAKLRAPALDLSDLDSLAATQELLAETGLLTR